jgi:hypothetical protein
MSNRVSLSSRDVSLLRLLSWTPATTTLLLRASPSFEGDPFTDERRIRERLQSLGAAGFVRSWSSAQAGGGLKNYYKLTPSGFQRLYGNESPQPSRAFFVEISPSLFDHTFRLAEVIVEVVRACHEKRVTIERFIRENELSFRVGVDQVQPDCFFRLKSGGRTFNLAFEIDNSTESLDSHAVNSVRTKLRIYDVYQEVVLSQWLAAGRKWERPRLRVVFLTRSIERAYHILSLAAATTRNRTRRLVYAATHESFVTEPHPLNDPIFLDHFGAWQSLIDLHPTAPSSKTPVRLTRAIESPFGVR